MRRSSRGRRGRRGTSRGSSRSARIRPAVGGVHDAEPAVEPTSSSIVSRVAPAGSGASGQPASRSSAIANSGSCRTRPSRWRRATRSAGRVVGPAHHVTGRLVPAQRRAGWRRSAGRRRPHRGTSPMTLLKFAYGGSLTTRVASPASTTWPPGSDRTPRARPTGRRRPRWRRRDRWALRTSSRPRAPTP